METIPFKPYRSYHKVIILLVCTEIFSLCFIGCRNSDWSGSDYIEDLGTKNYVFEGAKTMRSQRTSVWFYTQYGVKKNLFARVNEGLITRFSPIGIKQQSIIGINDDNTDGNSARIVIHNDKASGEGAWLSLQPQDTANSSDYASVNKLHHSGPDIFADLVEAPIESNNGTLITSNNTRNTVDWFFPESYGATPNDGLNDSTGINAAIRASVAAGWGREGKVYLGAGSWNLTGPIIMLDRVTLIMHENAQILLPSGYTGDAILFQDGKIHTNFYIYGGSFQETAPLGYNWTGIHIDKQTSLNYHATGGQIENVRFFYAGQMVDVDIDNNGFCNDVIFDRLYGFRFRKGIVTDINSSGEFSGNTIMNCEFQAGDSTEFGLDIDGVENAIFANKFWDWNKSDKSPNNHIVFDATSRKNQLFFNSVMGEQVDDYGSPDIDDKGSLNQIIGHSNMYNKFAGEILIASGGEFSDTTNKITIVNGGDYGTSGNPDGWMGMRLVPTNTGGISRRANSTWFSSDIVAANEATNNRYGFMQLRVHDSSTDHGEEGMQVGLAIDGSENAKVIMPGGYNFAADAQGNDNYEISLPFVESLVIGMTVTFTANTANTGACTLEITEVGEIDSIKKMHDQDLATGDIEAGQVVVCVFDGTNWQMISQLAK